MFYYDIKKSGKRIKELRKAKGLTQDKLSEKIGISCQGLKMIECGINGARIDTFVYLAEALDTTMITWSWAEVVWLLMNSKRYSATNSKIILKDSILEEVQMSRKNLL